MGRKVEHVIAILPNCLFMKSSLNIYVPSYTLRMLSTLIIEEDFFQDGQQSTRYSKLFKMMRIEDSVLSPK